MAFNVQGLGRNSVSANEPIVTLTDPTVVGCFREFNYYTADTQATVSASGYFNSSTAYDDMGSYVVTGDYINVYSSTDGSRCRYRFTNTSGVVTTSFINGYVQATVEPTLTAFLAAYTTPITVIAAPGANRQLIFLGAQVTVEYGSAGFANGGAMHIQYTTTTAGAGTKASATAASTVLTNISADSTFTLIPAAVVNTAVADVVNVPLCFSNATAVWINGTAAELTISAAAFIVPANY